MTVSNDRKTAIVHKYQVPVLIGMCGDRGGSDCSWTVLDVEHMVVDHGWSYSGLPPMIPRRWCGRPVSKSLPLLAPRWMGAAPEILVRPLIVVPVEQRI